MTYIVGRTPDALVELPRDFYAAVIADPPYGMAYRSSRTTDRVTAEGIEGDGEFDPAFHVEWLLEARKHVVPGGALYVFIDDQHLGQMRDCVRAAGWWLKRSCVWLKDAWTVGDLSGDYGHQTEFCVFAHNMRHKLAGPRESNVWRCPRVPPDKLEHPTEKPVALLRYLIRKSVPKGRHVLDPFAGIGTTEVAAIAEGRKCDGVECDERWESIARRRIAEAKFEPHGEVEQIAMFGSAA